MRIARRELDLDHLRKAALRHKVEHVMRMHVGSVFLAAIPCICWVEIGHWSAGRRLNNNSQWVSDQNALVSRLVYVLILWMKRGVYWIVEQPTSSIVFEHPRWRYMERKYGHLINAVMTDLGVYTYDMVKTTVLKGER